jgi:drug/metabolite transporter (DMT)-like permease
MSSRVLFKLFLCALIGYALIFTCLINLLLQNKNEKTINGILMPYQEFNNQSLVCLWKLLFRIALGVNLYHVSLKFTSATVASAADSSLPAITFFFAVLLRLYPSISLAYHC